MWSDTPPSSPHPSPRPSRHRPCYAFGVHHEAPFAAALVPTAQGWRCRATGELCHDYVSGESVQDVREWLVDCDRARHVELVTDREEARGRLATLLASNDGFLGFLAPPMPPSEAAEAVLRHLERGW